MGQAMGCQPMGGPSFGEMETSPAAEFPGQGRPAPGGWHGVLGLRREPWGRPGRDSQEAAFPRPKFMRWENHDVASHSNTQLQSAVFVHVFNMPYFRISLPWDREGGDTSGDLSSPQIPSPRLSLKTNTNLQQVTLWLLLSLFSFPAYL